MRAQYRKLRAVPGFQRLRATTPLFATWDDHDYGQDDAGADYPMKEVSREMFIKFFRGQAPAPSPSGIHEATTLGPVGRRVQIILLDVRWYRDDPKDDTTATLLGDEQWQWLRERLAEPAELRLFVSGTQVIPEDYQREGWARFPCERERLLNLIAEHGPALILSGDRHLAELSRVRWNDTTLHELTSSGLNVAIGSPDRDDHNRYRLGDAYYGDNFAVVTVHWRHEPMVELTVRDVAGRVVMRHTNALGEHGD